MLTHSKQISKIKKIGVEVAAQIEQMSKRRMC